jgi:type III secretion protein U
LSCSAILAYLFSAQDSLMSSGKEIITFSISKTNIEFKQAAGEVFTKVFHTALGTILAIVGIALVMKIVGTWMQTGPMFAAEALKMDFNKFNPINQLKNMFSMKKIYEMINNIIKAVILTYVFYILIKKYFPTLILLPTGDLDMTWKSCVLLFKSSVNISLVILLVMAVFDFAMQKYFHNKSLKMSIDEIKKEYKESEGDPHMKGHLSQLRHEVLESEPEDIEGSVKQADAVVVNPTHYAVALYYRAGETPLPKILVKGHDDKAKKIIEFARKYDKPIIRYVWLARTLYAHKGQYIPKPTMQAVVAIYHALKPILQEENEDQYEDENQDEEISQDEMILHDEKEISSLDDDMESQEANNQGANNHEDKFVEARSTEAKISEAKYIEAKSTGAKSTEAKSAETKSTEAKNTDAINRETGSETIVDSRIRGTSGPATTLNEDDDSAKIYDDEVGIDDEDKPIQH